jgi:rsbT antagonist protein RsbS
MPGISILRQRDILLATLPSTLTDRELARLRRDLLDRIGRDRSRAVILDVTAVDVLDSFATKLLGELTEAARLRGALVYVVGIRPEVAMAMVLVGLSLPGVRTAVDLEQALTDAGVPEAAG